MREAVIRFDGVSKSYPLYHHITGGLKNFLFHFHQAIMQMRNSRFEALKDISFEIFRGETFAIIGRNGAGKSTMLGLMANILKPTAGRVSVRERVSPLLELGAGFHPELSGRENIILNGVLMGFTRGEILKKVDEIVDFSELGEFIEQPIRIYSSGMLARLGFSVVSSLDPQILLIDEVLAVGDSHFQKKCLDKMTQFRDRGVTIVLVTHSPESVRNLCHRVLWIEDHRIKALGTPDEVLGLPQQIPPPEIRAVQASTVN